MKTKTKLKKVTNKKIGSLYLQINWEDQTLEVVSSKALERFAKENQADNSDCEPGDEVVNSWMDDRIDGKGKYKQEWFGGCDWGFETSFVKLS